MLSCIVLGFLSKISAILCRVIYGLALKSASLISKRLNSSGFARSESGHAFSIFWKPEPRFSPKTNHPEHILHTRISCPGNASGTYLIYSKFWRRNTYGLDTVRLYRLDILICQYIMTDFIAIDGIPQIWNKLLRIIGPTTVYLFSASCSLLFSSTPSSTAPPSVFANAEYVSQNDSGSSLPAFLHSGAIRSPFFNFSFISCAVIQQYIFCEDNHFSMQHIYRKYIKHLFKSEFCSTFHFLKGVCYCCLLSPGRLRRLQEILS